MNPINVATILSIILYKYTVDGLIYFKADYSILCKEFFFFISPKNTVPPLDPRRHKDMLLSLVQNVADKRAFQVRGGGGGGGHTPITNIV